MCCLYDWFERTPGPSRPPLLHPAIGAVRPVQRLPPDWGGRGWGRSGRDPRVAPHGGPADRVPPPAAPISGSDATPHNRGVASPSLPPARPTVSHAYRCRPPGLPALELEMP